MPAQELGRVAAVVHRTQVKSKGVVYDAVV
jgi:hypothetical protein